MVVITRFIFSFLFWSFLHFYEVVDQFKFCCAVLEILKLVEKLKTLKKVIHKKTAINSFHKCHCFLYIAGKSLGGVLLSCSFREKN